MTESAPAGSAARGRVTYRSRTFLEREHAPTFHNLVTQTARVTAPPTTAPVPGRTEPLVVTGRLATVGHDLVSLPLYGGSKPYVRDEEGSDLVVMSDDLTVRSPGAGHLLARQPFDPDYRVELRWDEEASACEVVALAPVDTSSGRSTPGPTTTSAPATTSRSSRSGKSSSPTWTASVCS